MLNSKEITIAITFASARFALWLTISSLFLLRHLGAWCPGLPQVKHLPPFLKVGFWTLFDELGLVLGFYILGLLNLGRGLSSTTFSLEDNSSTLLVLSLVLFCSSINPNMYYNIF